MFLLNTQESNERICSNYSEMINATSLHDKDVYGRDVTIAVIDTGCYKHDLLRNNIIECKSFIEEDEENDYNGHGTHVAGIIAADFNSNFKSIAPMSKLIILKVLNKNGSGSVDSIVKAINYAVDRKVDIINMSLGAPKYNEALYQAVKRAVDNNICVVCASGNSGDDNADTDESDYPGCFQEVIEVGAMDSFYNVSTFSNSNKFIDLVAPGEAILSTCKDNGFKPLSGTSMAAPIVTGALALLIEWSTKEFGRRLSESELFALLIKNTKTIENCKRSLQGNGFLYFNI